MRFVVVRTDGFPVTPGSRSSGQRAYGATFSVLDSAICYRVVAEFRGTAPPAVERAKVAAAALRDALETESAANEQVAA